MTEAPRRRPRGRSTRPERSGAPTRARGGATPADRPDRPAGRPASRRTRPTRQAESGRRWWRQPSDAGEPTSGAGDTPGLGRSRLVRQIAILGVVICVVATMLAYPLRSYLDQRAELAAAISEQRAAEREAAELALQNEALDDPDYIRTEAKRRLQYVNPGDTVYVYRGPEVVETGEGSAPETDIEKPWYSTLWDTLTPLETNAP